MGLIKRDYQAIKLETSHGDVSCRYYKAPAAHCAILCVGGVGGDWDSPARDLYPRLCRVLVGESISCLRMRYRHPTDLEESVHDVLAGLAFLEQENLDTIGLLGHSLGGAVVIQAAAVTPKVRTVVTLATQSYGASPVFELGPRCSLLLLHGTADRVLPPSSSEYVYNIAQQPKRLILYEGAGHSLNEVASEVYQVVRQWILDNLTGASTSSAS